jgi:4-diphosphocytidyl-2-C-methyl-D-erythritol kinase
MLTVRAYAKINLGLRILGRRKDGYHDIETVFHRIDLFDEVSLAPADGLTLECFPESLPSDERNLCYQAAQLLSRRLHRSPGASIVLRKAIPEGAGLGGGSSDAAATLLGLVQLWDADLPAGELRDLALRLGSDVPYFLNDGSAYATGRGEVLDYFRLELPYWIVVVYPHLAISTAWAYRNFTTNGTVQSEEPIPLKEVLRNEIGNPARLNALIRNDFEPLVEGTHRIVAEAKRLLVDSGAGVVRLSGSGSAVFGFFQDELRTRAAAKALQRRFFVSVTPPYFEPEPG